jgi:hypothetical protein
VAIVAERGSIAAIALLLAFIGIIANAFQSTRGSGAGNPGVHDPFLTIAVTATVLVTGAVGSFDAVTLLAAPALIVWASLGALGAPGRTRFEWAPLPASRRLLALVATVPLLLFALRSGGETAAMQVFGSGDRLGNVEQSALLDPGSYRIQMRLAVLALNRRGCSRARPHARRAAEMFPAAGAPRSILRRCGAP